VLQSPSTYLKNSITYLNKLIIKPNESADFSLNPYSGMHIDYVYVKNDMCRFINCVIGKLVTNRVTLNLNFTNSYINSIDVVDVLDFELVEDMIGISYFSALLSTLRTLQNKPSEFLTKDSVTIYLSDVHDESGYFIYFEALVEDYLEIISEYFRVSINSLNVDVKKKKVQFTHASGVKVNVYLSNLSKSEIESRLTHIEMRNYE
jgi:septum formation topological specificity factor MinE